MREKPRILVLSTAYAPLIGGSELALRNLVERMTEFEFDILTARLTDAPKAERIGRSQVYRIGGPKFLLPLTLAFAAVRLMRAGDYALVHAYQASQAAGAGWLLSFFRRTPFLVTLQEGKELDRQNPLVRLGRWLILRRASALTAISVYLCQYAQRFSTAPCILIPNGVDAAGFSSVSEETRDRVRSELELDADTDVIISVSRLVEKNNIETLVRAFARLEGEPILVLVGDGPRKPRLLRLTDELGVYERVRFVGTVPHERLPGYLSVATVFARPSRSEGLGTAFLEAMAAGLPVVASPVGGIPDIVQDGLNGLLAEPDDEAGIALCLSRILGNGLLAKQFSEHALETAADYDWSHIADRMTRVYRGIIRT